MASAQSLLGIEMQSSRNLVTVTMMVTIIAYVTCGPARDELKDFALIILFNCWYHYDSCFTKRKTEGQR